MSLTEQGSPACSLALHLVVSVRSAGVVLPGTAGPAVAGSIRRMPEDYSELPRGRLVVAAQDFVVGPGEDSALLAAADRMRTEVATVYQTPNWRFVVCSSPTTGFGDSQGRERLSGSGDVVQRWRTGANVELEQRSVQVGSRQASWAAGIG